MSPGGPREGVEELELRGVLVGAEGDVIEEDVIEENVIEGPGDTGDIKALESGVGDLNKSFLNP